MNSLLLVEFAQKYGESPNYVAGLLQPLLVAIEGRKLTEEENKKIVKEIHEHFQLRAVMRGLEGIGRSCGIPNEQMEAYFSYPISPEGNQT